MGKERVRKLMQRHGIKARGKRNFVVTTDSKHDLPIAPNLLARDLSPTAPHETWTSDITYIATDEGWHLAPKWLVKGCPVLLVSDLLLLPLPSGSQKDVVPK